MAQPSTAYLRARVLALSVACTACTGALDGGPASVSARSCDELAAPLPLQRLTADQYDNTLRDLLGDTTRPGHASLPSDATIEGFSVNTTISPIFVEAFINIAEEVAPVAIARPDFVPCAPGEDAASQHACAQQFVEEVGLRAYRRPVTSEEAADLMGVYAAAETNARPFDERLEWMLEAMLISPSFLYHETTQPSETPGSLVVIEDYELASRLSYFLWNTMPDDTLFAAAADGQLRTDADVEREVRRMIEDERAREGIRAFFAQWLDLDRVAGIARDGSAYPGFDANVSRDLAASLQMFVEEAFWNGDYATLMTSDRFFVNERLADVYDISGVTGETLIPVAAPEGQRLGLLTQPGLMALLSKSNETDPVHRGLFVRREILCETFGPPPAAAMSRTPAPPGSGSTTRDRFAMHADAACAGCHARIDPAGFAFENYDPIGRFRTTDEGLPVDASGEIVGSDDVDGHVESGIELAQRLATSRDAEHCMAEQFVRFAVRRPLERRAIDNQLTGADACMTTQVGRQFVAADGDFRELLVAVTQSDAFRLRRVPMDLGAEAVTAP